MVYAKEVETNSPRFCNKKINISYGQHQSIVNIPDHIVVCNGCNKNLFPNPGYLVYLGKRDLDHDHPYDIYCKECLGMYFPKVKYVDDKEGII